MYSKPIIAGDALPVMDGDLMRCAISMLMSQILVWREDVCLSYGQTAQGVSLRGGYTLFLAEYLYGVSFCTLQ